MSAVSIHDEDLRVRTLLLREVIELLMWELAAISGRKWENLPELKKKKSEMAERLRKFDWTPGPAGHESLEVMMLKSQISDLEYQSKQKIGVHLKLIRAQLDVLREQQQSRLECFNIYLRKSSDLVSSL